MPNPTPAEALADSHRQALELFAGQSAFPPREPETRP